MQYLRSIFFRYLFVTFFPFFGVFYDTADFTIMTIPRIIRTGIAI